MQDTNEQAIRRLHHAINTGSFGLLAATVDDVVAADAEIHAPIPMGSTGPRAIKDVFQRLYYVFPDLQVKLEDLIAHEDKVVTRNTVTGTQCRDHFGVAPAGRTITYSEIFIYRFADGWIVESWGVVDVFAQLRKLGIAPGPTPPGDGTDV